MCCNSNQPISQSSHCTTAPGRRQACAPQKENQVNDNRHRYGQWEVVPSMDSIATGTHSPVAQQRTDIAAGTELKDLAPVTFLIMRQQLI